MVWDRALALSFWFFFCFSWIHTWSSTHFDDDVWSIWVGSNDCVNTLYCICHLLRKALGFGQFDIISWTLWSAQQFFFLPPGHWFADLGPTVVSGKGSCQEKEKMALIDGTNLCMLGCMCEHITVGFTALKKAHVKGVLALDRCQLYVFIVFPSFRSTWSSVASLTKLPSSFLLKGDS